jgi:hypothetical protein
MSQRLSYSDLTGALQVTLHEPDSRLQHVPEAVLQDIWARMDFDHAGLETTAGLPVQICSVGTLNRDGGPDFSDAHVRVDGVDWFGDVEIHRTSGEWLVHRHEMNARYDRVVLHVTLARDRHTGQLRRSDGSPIPEVVLLPRLRSPLRKLLYRFFAHPSPDFPCASRWREVPERIRRPWLRLLGQERLRVRLGSLGDRASGAGNLEELLYRAVMRTLGYAPNADAMESLARRAPLAALLELDERRDIEALLLGTAGLLPRAAALPAGDPTTKSYIAELEDRYRRLAHLSAGEMLPSAWQLARLRPANTPARRIAQAAALLAPGGLLHHDPLPRLETLLRAGKPLPALRDTLMAAEPDEHWRTHTRPGRRCRESPAGIGKGRADDLLVNALLPALLAVAVQRADHDMEDEVLDVYAALPASSDRVTRIYEEHGAGPQNALEAQGLHQLLRTRCGAGRGLSCSVGRWLLDR